MTVAIHIGNSHDSLEKSRRDQRLNPVLLESIEIPSVRAPYFSVVRDEWLP